MNTESEALKEYPCGYFEEENFDVEEDSLGMKLQINLKEKNFCAFPKHEPMDKYDKREKRKWK